MSILTLSEKVAYLKGLLEGMNKDDKVINLIADILRDMADEIRNQQNEIDQLSQEVDSVENGLTELEAGCDDYDEGNYSGDGYDPAFSHTDDDDDDDEYEDDEDDFGDDEDLYEVTCPTCGHNVRVDSAILEEGSITCPKCGELLEFDTEETDDDIFEKSDDEDE